MFDDDDYVNEYFNGVPFRYSEISVNISKCIDRSYQAWEYIPCNGTD
jgi:hypothetical protein